MDVSSFSCIFHIVRFINFLDKISYPKYNIIPVSHIFAVTFYIPPQLVNARISSDMIRPSPRPNAFRHCDQANYSIHQTLRNKIISLQHFNDRIHIPLVVPVVKVEIRVKRNCDMCHLEIFHNEARITRQDETAMERSSRGDTTRCTAVLRALRRAFLPPAYYLTTIQQSDARCIARQFDRNLNEPSIEERWK